MAEKKVNLSRFFDVFKHECRHWCSVLGLVDWDIVFRLEDDDNSFASYRANLSSRKCVFSFNSKDIDIECLDSDLDDRMLCGRVCYSAFHESAHLLLVRLQRVVDDYLAEDTSAELTHECIGRLVSAFFDPVKNFRVENTMSLIRKETKHGKVRK